MSNIVPTRSELLKVKARIKLAQSGHKLLKKKRDGLILEFFEILKKAKSIRQELVTDYKEAVSNVNIARTFEGDLKIKSLALAITDNPAIELEQKNIMGVRVPKIQGSKVTKDALQRGYGAMATSQVLDTAIDSYEKVVEKIILAAEVETTMKRLLTEIEKTKRRVNALEFAVLPKLEGIKKFIQFRLDEMDRENIFRMKRMQK